jgi:uncharacterized RDD family membrane protein YckC
MAWYYEIDRQQRGPVTDEEFASLVQSGVVRAETLVWQEGWPDWRAFSQVSAGGAKPAVGAVAVSDDTAVCAVSGQRRPKRDMLEFEGRWVSAEHKEEFFQRLREGVVQPQEMVYATFGQRFGAKIIDGVILWVVNMVLALGVGAALGALFASQSGGADGAAGLFIAIQVVVQIVSMSASLLYALYFIRKYDATPGKRMLKLKVLRADGSRLSKGRIVGRYFAELVSGIILCIGYLMVAFDKEQRRALHDKMCDTRVVKG